MAWPTRPESLDDIPHMVDTDQRALHPVVEGVICAYVGDAAEELDVITQGRRMHEERLGTFLIDLADQAARAGARAANELGGRS